MIIAHRLSTIKVAHRIAVLDMGDRGAGHARGADAANGLYARLYTMQFRNPEDELATLLRSAQLSDGGNKLPEKQAGLLDVILRRS